PMPWSIGMSMKTTWSESPLKCVIERHVFAEVPPRVEYEVTAFGQSLEPVLTSMQDWGRAFKARRLASMDSED
ncbi:MAG: winged helix-turn-helix transcriptional regulator, partial [Phycisphaerales bacterium]|nr:winged helix-turn-helix transcriptional regulator [Phycisphaerales bacterium]